MILADLKEGTLKLRIQSVKPTMFAGVPRVWEKFVVTLKSKARTGCLGSFTGQLKSILKANALNKQVGGDGSQACGTCMR